MIIIQDNGRIESANIEVYAIYIRSLVERIKELEKLAKTGGQHENNRSES